jgi:hypothetical protein
MIWIFALGIITGLCVNHPGCRNVVLEVLERIKFGKVGLWLFGLSGFAFVLIGVLIAANKH